MTSFSKLGRFDKLLLVLGVVAAIALASPGIIILATISVVGIPIALMLMFAPGVFFVTLMARLLHHLLKIIGIHAWPVSGLGALALLAAAAAYFNYPLEQKALALVAGDSDTLTLPLRPRTLAMVNIAGGGGFGNDTPCDDFCQRALLSGVAQRFVAVKLNTYETEWSDVSKGLVFYLEKRENCPAVDLQAGYGSITFKSSKERAEAGKADDLMRLKIAQGLCLVKDVATLAQADTIIAMGRIHRGVFAIDSGLDPSVDTIFADRITVHIRENNELNERYRWTGVVTEKHFPILAPSIMMGNGFHVALGFQRWREYKGISTKYYFGPDFSSFLLETLGLKLALNPEGSDKTVKSLIIKALDSPGAIDRAVLKVVEDYFQRFSNSKTLSAEDELLAFRILGDERVPIPRFTWAVLRLIANSGPEKNRELASILFKRLASANPIQKEDDPNYLGYTLSYLADSIALLPDAAIRPHRVELEKLAHNPVGRKSGYQALTRLSVFGADAVPTLIYLIDDAARLRDEQPKESGKHDASVHAYLAGIIGLCKMGSDGKSAVQPLLDRLRSGTLVTYGSYRELVINTLVGLGADPEDIWLNMQSDDPNESRERMDQVVRRAAKKLDCGY